MPAWGPRPGWACTSHVLVHTAAPDRNIIALISWPVTIDTHSCAALREQAEHRRGLQGAGKASSENTGADEHIQDLCHHIRTKDGTSWFCPRGYPTDLYTSVRLHCDFPLLFFELQQHLQCLDKSCGLLTLPLLLHLFWCNTKNNDLNIINI